MGNDMKNSLNFQSNDKIAVMRIINKAAVDIVAHRHSARVVVVVVANRHTPELSAVGRHFGGQGADRPSAVPEACSWGSFGGLRRVPRVPGHLFRGRAQC
jgi:hypothetical protein